MVEGKPLLPEIDVEPSTINNWISKVITLIQKCSCYAVFITAIL